MNGLVEEVMGGIDEVETKKIWLKAFAELLQVQDVPGGKRFIKKR